MKKILNKYPSLLSILFLVLILGTFYFKTIAPGLTWANNGADGGDFISAAATGGVAHPPGYPFYLTLAKLFQLIPVSNIAYRTNLLSLVCTISAAILLFKLAERISCNTSFKWVVGLSSSLVFGLSQLVWSQAVITEVYALQELLLLSFLTFLSKNKNGAKFSGGVDIVIGIILGLAIQNHLTAVFFLPLFVVIGIVSIIGDRSTSQKKIQNICKFPAVKFNWKSLLFRIMGLIIGLLFTLTIFIRANSGSPIIWGEPKSISNFLWLISGKMYSGSLFNFSFDFLLTRINLWGSIVKDQIGVIGLIISAIGFVIIGSKSIKKTIFTLWIFLSFFIFSLLYNSIDSFVYLIFSIIAISLWFGWGVEVILSFLKSNKILQVSFTLLLIAGLLGYAFKTYPKVDASNDKRAENFGKQVVLEAPNDAIIFTDADKDSFTLWYFQYVQNERIDVFIVVEKLLIYEWYRHSLASVYPSLLIPESTTGSWQKDIKELNPNKAFCNTIVIEDAYISCNN